MKERNGENGRKEMGVERSRGKQRRGKVTDGGDKWGEGEGIGGKEEIAGGRKEENERK